MSDCICTCRHVIYQPNPACPTHGERDLDAGTIRRLDAQRDALLDERDHLRVALEEANRVLTDWPSRSDLALLIIRSALYDMFSVKVVEDAE
jgi:hypothetical protein